MKKSNLSKVDFKRLFRQTYTVQDISSNLQKQSLTLMEISMNAAIAAEHTGTQTRVFSEIAKQIALISKQLHETSEKAQNHTGMIINAVLVCIHEANLFGKFQKALPTLSGENNVILVQNVILNLRNEGFAYFEKMRDQLAHVKTHEEYIKQMIHRIWSISVNLKLAAENVNPEEETFYLSIAEALEQLCDKTAQLIGQLSETLSDIEFRLNIHREPHVKKGEQRAA